MAVDNGSDKIADHMQQWRKEFDALAARGITLIGSFPEGGPLNDPHFGPLNVSAMGDPGIQILGRAMSGDVFRHLRGPAVIDVDKAATAYRALGTPYDNEATRRSLVEGRLRLQGTDGVRGPVALRSEGDPVSHFGRTGELTPELVVVLCYSFGRIARKAGVVRKLGRVVTAEDGRDAATGWELSAAMKKGLQDAGLTVVDLGVAPTPAAPFAQARLGIRLGVVLTASHNPASQNGVKFFVDGFKMLPEGPVGDYALTATAYVTAHEGHRKVEKGALEDGSATVEAFCDYIVENLPPESAELLKSLDLVFDGANGAFARIGPKVFERLGLDVHTVNAEPKGSNINQGGGVAEIEGRRVITAEEAGGSPSLASIAAMLKRAGRVGGTVYGMVMDGDGDRGYVVATREDGRALVVDGDREGYVLARAWRESGLISDAEAREYHFQGTVESDLMVFREVEERLGLATDIACVGDKWLVSGHRAGRRLAVGEETSGHVLWPTRTTGPDGDEREVVTGNGLLTTLAVLAAAARLRLAPEELAEPFGEGVFITRYTYNVNKALFFPGSHAWEEDLKVFGEALDAARGDGFDTWRTLEKPDEPEMIYVGLFDARERIAGAVFVRNSGTENKTCVYARGVKSLEPVLKHVCLLVWQMHRQVLKDKSLRAYRIETGVLSALEQGPLFEDALLERLSASIAGGMERDEMETVLYGMRKEGLIAFDAGRIGRTQ